MKKALYILLFCMHTLYGSAENVLSSAIDSLLATAQTLPHDATRLQLLNRLVFMAQNSPRHLELTQQLYDEAKLQNSEHFICNAAYSQALHYYNEDGHQDSIAKWVNLLKPIAEKINYWKVYFNSQKLLINTYIYKHQYEYAFNEALLMLEKAQKVKNIVGEVASYECLATIYHETNRWSEEEIVLKKAYALIPNLTHPAAKINTLCQLITFSRQRKNYKELKTYLDQSQNILNEIERKEPEVRRSLFNHRLFLETHYTHLYLGNHDLQQAKLHHDKAQSYITPRSYPSYVVMFLNASIKYHLQVKEFKTALNLADSAMSFITKYEFERSDYAKEMTYKADILKKMGRYTEALPLYEKSIEIQDSLNAAVSNKQLEEIKDTYHLNQLLLEQGKLRSYIQIIILSVVVVILILCITYILRINRIRKDLRSSEKRIREAALNTEEANEMKTRFLSNMSHAIRVPLNSVVGFSQLMATDAEMTENSRKEYSDIIQQNTDKLLLLVNNVLDLSRLEADMMKFQLADCDIVQLCNDAISAAHMQNANLHINFKSSIEHYDIHSDCNRLIQLIISTLVGPFTNTTECHDIQFSLHKNGEILCFKISNSPLASCKQNNQDVSVRHDINRLILAHFQGTYQVITDVASPPAILFTYPATSME